MKPPLSQRLEPSALEELTSGGSSIPASGNSYFLHAGQVYVSREPQSVVLILGSCVAVCIWDPNRGIGGATHYLLPTWDGRGTASPRYGNVAISTLLQKLVDAGADRRQLRAKVFGGGCLFDTLRKQGTNGDHIGQRNVETAAETLLLGRIPVVSSEVGGDRGKRVIFHTDTGEATTEEL
jgi:chemotaxis protein CheD